MWFNLPFFGRVGLLTGQHINGSLTALFVMFIAFVAMVTYNIYKAYFYQPILLLKEEYIVHQHMKPLSEYKRNPDGSVDAIFEEL